MARLPRLAVPGRMHYLRQQAVHGQALAIDDIDRQALLDALAQAADATGVLLWAYALEEQTLHLLATPDTPDALGRMMQILGRRYVGAFNRRHQRRGALWGGRFGAAVVEDGECTLSVLTFIDGLLDPESPWSSAPHHLGRRRHPMLRDPPELWTLGNTPFERESGFRARLSEGSSDTMAGRLTRAVRGSWAFGSAAFAAEVAEQVGRAATPRPRGRPRRAAD